MPKDEYMSDIGFAYLSYAMLREILYTRTMQVNMRVRRPTYIVLTRR